MLYASDNPSTALKEVCKKKGVYVVARFRTERDAHILDLSRIPPKPSYFEEFSDSLEYDPRRIIDFVQHVSCEISKPVARNERSQILYVPTQVVTEYVRSTLTMGKARIRGIRYASSVHAGHFSYVIFATRNNISPAPKEETRLSLRRNDRWIRLTGRKEYDVQVHTDFDGKGGHE